LQRNITARSEVNIYGRLGINSFLEVVIQCDLM